MKTVYPLNSIMNFQIIDYKIHLINLRIRSKLKNLLEIKKNN